MTDTFQNYIPEWNYKRSQCIVRDLFNWLGLDFWTTVSVLCDFRSVAGQNKLITIFDFLREIPLYTNTRPRFRTSRTKRQNGVRPLSDNLFRILENASRPRVYTTGEKSRKLNKTISPRPPRSALLVPLPGMISPVFNALILFSF